MHLSIIKKYYNVKPSAHFSCEDDYIERFWSLYYGNSKVKSVIVTNNKTENLQKNSHVFEFQQQNHS